MWGVWLRMSAILEGEAWPMWLRDEQNLSLWTWWLCTTVALCTAAMYARTHLEQEGKAPEGGSKARGTVDREVTQQQTDASTPLAQKALGGAAASGGDHCRPQKFWRVVLGAEKEGEKRGAVRVRRGPDLEAEHLSLKYTGEVVKATARLGDWIRLDASWYVLMPRHLPLLPSCCTRRLPSVLLLSIDSAATSTRRPGC